MSVIEILGASQIHEVLNSLFNFALITSNEEMQHIAIKASETVEMKLIQHNRAISLLILCELMFCLHVCLCNMCVF